MTHGSLFSGIGGFDLAAHWAGIPTVWQVEKDAYCRAVLRKHFPNAKQYEDIKNVKGILADTISIASKIGRDDSTNEKESIERRTYARGGRVDDSGFIGTKTNETDDAKRKDHPLASVDIISGGFPCQPFSVAGKQRGKSDDRFLWPEMLRIIAEVRPAWVIAENVAGIIRMELDSVLSSLEAEGYTAWPLVIPACGIGAPHRRDRVWIVAHSECNQHRGTQRTSIGLQETISGINRPQNGSAWESSGANQISEANDRHDVPDANSEYSEEQFGRNQPEQAAGEASPRWSSDGDGRLWQVEPDVGRVAHGIPRRVDRLKALGNAIVPQVAYQIFKAIKEIEIT